jgi:hypothetical protein
MSAPKDQSIRQLYELICLINTNRELKRKAKALALAVDRSDNAYRYYQKPDGDWIKAKKNIYTS